MAVLPFAALVLCFFLPAGECQQLIIDVEHSIINVTVGRNALFSVQPTDKVRSGNWIFKQNTVGQWINQTTIIDNEYVSRAELITSNWSLLLKSVNTLDSGEYRVNMVPVIGKQVSATITLRVLEPVSNVTVTPNDTRLIEYNDTVSLTCFANGTAVSYMWIKANSPVTSGGRFELSADNSTLTISGVLRTDGLFTCRAANSISNLTSNQFNLNVYYGPDRPSITTKPTSNAYIAGSNITLTCSAVSRPDANLTWYFSGDLLQTGQEFSLTNISVNETGNYTCQAYNNITKRFNASTQEINVLEAPDPTPDGSGGSSGLSAGAIAGIVIAVIAVVVLVALILWVIKKKASRLNTGCDKSDPKTTSPENIQSSQTEYAEIERKKPSQPKPTPSSNGTNAAPAQAKDEYVIYTRPNIINAGAKPTSEPVIDNRTDYAEVKYR